MTGTPGGARGRSVALFDEAVRGLVPREEEPGRGLASAHADDLVDGRNHAPRRLLPAPQRAEVDDHLDLRRIGVAHAAAVADDRERLLGVRGVERPGERDAAADAGEYLPDRCAPDVSGRRGIAADLGDADVAAAALAQE